MYVLYFLSFKITTSKNNYKDSTVYRSV